MNEQERQVISGIFERLTGAAQQPRDPEAERFIADRVREQPYAPYAMAQTIFVQEQALTNLNQQVEALQREVQELRNRPQASGGFLASLFGGGSRPAPQPTHGRPMGGPTGAPMGHHPQMGQPHAPQGGPWGGQPGMGHPGMMGGQPGMMGQPGPFGQRPGGGGFMGTAMATAAGVAGGMMLGSALSNAFGGGSANAAEAGATPAAADAAAAGGEGDLGAPLHDASYDGGADDFGGDMGGDDWA
jgi:hypothetical protein